MFLRFEAVLMVLALFVFLGCPAGNKGSGTSKDLVKTKQPAQKVKIQLDKLVPVILSCDISSLPESERETLELLVKAAKYMDSAFLLQVSGDNPAIKEELSSRPEKDAGVHLEYFKTMFGPWDRLDEEHPFINDAAKPEGANFYPLDMTKDEFKNWLEEHPGDREAFESNFTVIRRKDDGLAAIPYSEFFAEQLEPAAALLRKAAETTNDPTLGVFLKSRADAFLSDDYYQSDMDWMDLSGDIEVVIGPYEVYEDGLFGYKAAFESFVCVVDAEESAKLEKIGESLDEMEKNLPNPEEHKNFDRGSSSPIKVVNEVFTAGDTKAGIQTIAFNLPNDERVREAKGSKKVMLKNILKAKYEKIYMPIVKEVLAEKELERISFDVWFTHILLHEVSHGLGPGRITIDGTETTVNKELKEIYSTIEECKADILGVYNVQFLVDRGVLPKEMEQTLYSTYVGGMFRSIRFGIHEAHGGGMAIQLNYIMEKGGIGVDENGCFFVNDDAIREAVRGLSHDVLVIEAEGDYEGAKQLIEKYRILSPETEAALKRIENVPIDIRPVFPIEETLK